MLFHFASKVILTHKKRLNTAQVCRTITLLVEVNSVCNLTHRKQTERDGGQTDPGGVRAGKSMDRRPNGQDRGQNSWFNWQTQDHLPLVCFQYITIMTYAKTALSEGNCT